MQWCTRAKIMNKQVKSLNSGMTHAVHFARLFIGPHSSVKREPGPHEHSVGYKHSRADIVNHPESAEAE